MMSMSCSQGYGFCLPPFDLHLSANFDKWFGDNSERSRDRKEKLERSRASKVTFEYSSASETEESPSPSINITTSSPAASSTGMRSWTDDDSDSQVSSTIRLNNNNKLMYSRRQKKYKCRDCGDMIFCSDCYEREMDDQMKCSSTESLSEAKSN